MSPRGLHRRDDDAEQIIANDALSNVIGGLFALCVLFLVLVNTPGREEVLKSDPPGNILIEIYWDETLDADVDLWVRGPEGSPVGYSNKGGEHYNYLRDDLGRTAKDDPINYEMSASRGLPKGPHCANVHLYSNRSGILPVHVKATVKIAKGAPGENAKGGGTPLLKREISLSAVGKERNLFCFTLDENGDIIEQGKLKPFTSDQICLRSPKGC